MNNGDKPAFPNEDALKGGDSSATGLTKREYFAAMAMQGVLSSSADRGEAAVVKMAMKFADQLLKALDSNP